MLKPGQLVTMVNFKEKPEHAYRLCELQREHWDNKLQSLLGVIFVTRADGALHREYMDICSEVATQDSDWVSAAITQHVQPRILSKHGHLTEIFGWSDFGSHFANNMVLAAWGKLGAALGVDEVWNFTEPGEGKSDCDRHFAQIGPRIKQHVRDHSILHGPADLALACNSIKNTKGVVLKRPTTKIKKYMTVKGIKMYISFKLPNNGKSYGNIEYLHGRDITESGPWKVFLPELCKYGKARSRYFL